MKNCMAEWYGYLMLYPRNLDFKVHLHWGKANAKATSLSDGFLGIQSIYIEWLQISKEIFAFVFPFANCEWTFLLIL